MGGTVVAHANRIRKAEHGRASTPRYQTQFAAGGGLPALVSRSLIPSERGGGVPCDTATKRVSLAELELRVGVAQRPSDDPTWVRRSTWESSTSTAWASRRDEAEAMVWLGVPRDEAESADW